MKQQCSNNDTVMDHIKIMTDNSNRSRSNTHRLDKIETELEDVKKTHAVLLNFETKIENIDDKVERQIEQSDKNTKEIIRALVSNKKTIQDRILDWVVPVVGFGILYSIVQYVNSGGGF